MSDPQLFNQLRYLNETLVQHALPPDDVSWIKFGWLPSRSRSQLGPALTTIHIHIFLFPTYNKLDDIFAFIYNCCSAPEGVSYSNPGSLYSRSRSRPVFKYSYTCINLPFWNIRIWTSHRIWLILDNQSVLFYPCILSAGSGSKAKFKCQVHYVYKMVEPSMMVPSPDI